MLLVVVMSLVVASLVFWLSGIQLSDDSQSLGFYVSFIGLLVIMALGFMGVEFGVQYLPQGIAAGLVIPQIWRLIVGKQKRL